MDSVKAIIDVFKTAPNYELMYNALKEDYRLLEEAYNKVEQEKEILLEIIKILVEVKSHANNTK